MRRSIFSAAVVASAALAVAIAASAAAGHAGLKKVGGASRGSVATTVSPMVLAVVGRLVPGHSLSELASRGFQVAPALQDKAGAARGDLFAVYTSDPAATIAAMRGDPAVAAAGSLAAQSRDPALASGNRTLEDSAGASRLVHLAERSLVSGGFLTAAQLSDPGTSFLVSDDPTARGAQIVTVEVQSAVSTQALAALNGTPANGSAKAPGAITMFAAEVRGGSVVAAGYAAWETATPQQP